jgi:large subunit ribosomal protein L21
VFERGRYTFGLSSEALFWRELTVAYAIISAGGKQFRVNEGEVVHVPSMAAEVGSSVEFDALLEADGDKVEIGSSALEGHSVRATVVEHGRGRKVIVFKKKRRKQYKKTHGHRQNFTAVRIDSVGAASEKSE